MSIWEETALFWKDKGGGRLVGLKSSSSSGSIIISPLLSKLPETV